MLQLWNPSDGLLIRPMDTRKLLGAQDRWMGDRYCSGTPTPAWTGYKSGLTQWPSLLWNDTFPGLRSPKSYVQTLYEGFGCALLLEGKLTPTTRILSRLPVNLSCKTVVGKSKRWNVSGHTDQATMMVLCLIFSKCAAEFDLNCCHCNILVVGWETTALTYL